MSSDSDNESFIQDTAVMKPPESTQSPDGSTITYAWVILFNMCVDQERPYSIVRLSHFKETDFPWELITGELGSRERNRARKFDNFPDETFGIFAKIEHGNLLYL